MAQQELPPPEATEVWDPVPITIDPGDGHRPPSDAIVLFDGTDLSNWSGRDGDARWDVGDGAMTVRPGSGNLTTERAFGDVQLHVEWRTPAEIVGEGQGRGNSGVFLMEKYEVQVLDSWRNPTYVNGQAASIFKQHIPLVNASRGPGEWQAYDIIFTAPRFGANGTIERPATMTVLHNGVLVQNHVTNHRGDGESWRAAIRGARRQAADPAAGPRSPRQLPEYLGPRDLAARGESPALHQGRCCARLARREEQEYREYLTDE